MSTIGPDLLLLAAVLLILGGIVGGVYVADLFIKELFHD